MMKKQTVAIFMVLAMVLVDQCTEIKQDAYDRYMTQ